MSVQVEDWANTVHVAADPCRPSRTRHWQAVATNPVLLHGLTPQGAAVGE